jgi:hypothetical protein
MSEIQPENEAKTKTEEIKPETLKDLLGKATPTEWRYLLVIRRWSRQGSAYDDYADFELLYGEAEEIVIEEWNAGYPYSSGEDVLVIPKKVPVIILWKHVEDTGTGVKKKKMIYIFTKDGWKSVEV